MAGSTGGELIILHVRATRASNPEELRFPADDSLYEYAEQHELEKLRDHARRANATVQTRLVIQRAPIPAPPSAGRRRRKGPISSSFPRMHATMSRI